MLLPPDGDMSPREAGICGVAEGPAINPFLIFNSGELGSNSPVTIYMGGPIKGR